MRDEIYQTELLKLAARARGAGRLDEPRLSARVDNPLCGDRVTIDLRLDEDGRIEAFGTEVKACLLCQASASLIGEYAAGRTTADFGALRDQLDEMLKREGPPPNGAFEGFKAFLPVRPHKSRHECVLLPFDALKRAAAATG